MATRSENAVDKFVDRWQSASGSERANYQLFVHELYALLELPMPDPAREDTRDNAYVFERRITFRHGDGTESPGFIDCYRRATFVLEAKKVRQAEGKGFDDALCFTGRGGWKKRLPQIVDTLVAVGRVRRRKDGLAVIA